MFIQIPSPWDDSWTTVSAQLSVFNLLSVDFSELLLSTKSPTDTSISTIMFHHERGSLDSLGRWSSPTRSVKKRSFIALASQPLPYTVLWPVLVRVGNRPFNSLKPIEFIKTTSSNNHGLVSKVGGMMLYGWLIKLGTEWMYCRLWDVRKIMASSRLCILFRKATFQ